MDAHTGYAKSGTAHIAYSVIGDGPIEAQFVSSYTISIDSLEEEPHVAHYFRRLASFARLYRFDVRGIGLSDPSGADDPLTSRALPPTCSRCSTPGVSNERCSSPSPPARCAAIELAASRPDRVLSLVIVNGFARRDGRRRLSRWPSP